LIPLTSFFRFIKKLFVFRKIKVIDIIKAESAEEADNIFRKKWGKKYEDRFVSLS